MTDYPPDSRVEVRPFAHRLDGDTATIGDYDRQVFLAIPPSGLDILNSLANGATVGQAARQYQERHGQPVDIDGFLQALAAEGFVAAPNGSGPGAAGGPGDPTVNGSNGHRPGRSFGSQFNWLSPATAQRLLSTPVLVVCGLLSAAGLALVFNDPGVLPNFAALQFPRHLAVLTSVTFAIAMTGLMLHELAHVTAARAAGAPARIGLSHRLYVPVVETDMTGIWMAPKRQRYLGFLAGAIVDAASVSILIGLVWAHRRGWVGLSHPGELLFGAVIFTYIGRLLWQTFLFMRTDFYYALATALDCKSLMADTENYLENLIAKVRRGWPVADQSGIPRREMWAIRMFTVLWVGGRIISVGAMVAVTIPTLWFYFTTCYHFLTDPASAVGAFDFLTALLLAMSLTLLGIVLWARALYRGWRRRWASYRKAKAATV